MSSYFLFIPTVGMMHIHENTVTDNTKLSFKNDFSLILALHMAVTHIPYLLDLKKVCP